MVFASPIFLFLFLPLTLAAYFGLPRAWRNGVLLVASLAFYAWGEARYLPLIVGSVAFNWCMGRNDRRRRRTESPAQALAGRGDRRQPRRARRCSSTRISPWPTSTRSRRCSPSTPLARGHHPAAARHLVLHVPRHFLRRRRVQAQCRRRERNVPRFALYILLFPQLIAGPIIRWRDIAAQLRSREQRIARLRLGRAALRAGPGQEGADRQHARPRGRRRSSGSRRRADYAARLARPRVLHAADLFRFLRLFGHGDRPHARCSASASSRISIIRTSRAASASSGGAGTSRCRTGFAITCTFRSAATRRPSGAPTRTW